MVENKLNEEKSYILNVKIDNSLLKAIEEINNNFEKIEKLLVSNIEIIKNVFMSVNTETSVNND